MLHHPFSRRTRSTRIVVRVAQNGVVAQLTGASFETLDYLGEKRILDIGDDNAERAAATGSEGARMNIRKLPQALQGGEDQVSRVASLFAAFLAGVGYGLGVRCHRTS